MSWLPKLMKNWLENLFTWNYNVIQFFSNSILSITLPGYGYFITLDTNSYDSFETYRNVFLYYARYFYQRFSNQIVEYSSSYIED